MATQLQTPVTDDYRHGFHDSEEKYVFKSDKGLTREIVERISAMKDEPAWMRDFRLKAYELFLSKPMPTWGDSARLAEIDFADRQDRTVVGRRSRRHQTNVRPAGHSRGGTQVSLRRFGAVRVGSRLPQHE